MLTHRKSQAGSRAHYVYIYRDCKGAVQYVGYGRDEKRASSHVVSSHNGNLNVFLGKGQYTIDIAGPFGSEEMGRAVETGLISAMCPKCNKCDGSSKWRFRPLGIPDKFAGRIEEPALKRKDFFSRKLGLPKAPILFVKINDKDFDDGRVGYTPAHPPTDAQIIKRMEQWWMLGRFIEQWTQDARTSPSMLVGISGSPGNQTIIGAAAIDVGKWSKAEREGSLFGVRVRNRRDLDFCGLRGRRIAREANIKFGPFRTQTIFILDPNGTSYGGNPSIQKRY